MRLYLASMDEQVSPAADVYVNLHVGGLYGPSGTYGDPGPDVPAVQELVCEAGGVLDIAVVEDVEDGMPREGISETSA